MARDRAGRAGCRRSRPRSSRRGRAAGAAPAEPPVEVSPEEQHAACSARSPTCCSRPATPRAAVLVFEDVHWADPTTLGARSSASSGSSRRSRCSSSLTMRAGARPGVGVRLLRDGRDARPPGRVRARGARRRHPGRHAPAGGAGVDDRGAQRRRAAVRRGAGARATRRRHAAPRRTPAGSSRTCAARLAVPDTLRDLLLARLDQLGAARVVAQVGAVLGRRFDRDLLRRRGGARRGGGRRGARPARGRRASPRARTRGERALRLQARSRPGCGLRVAHALRPAGRCTGVRRATLEERRPDVVAAEPEVLARHLDAAGERALAATW